jgi:hypothetical protein
MEVYLFRQTFFGLNPDHKKHLFEELFQLMWNGKITITEAQRLPVYQRRWLIQRIIKQIDMENKEIEKASNKGRSK